MAGFLVWSPTFFFAGNSCRALFQILMLNTYPKTAMLDYPGFVKQVLGGWVLWRVLGLFAFFRFLGSLFFLGGVGGGGERWREVVFFLGGSWGLFSSCFGFFKGPCNVLCVHRLIIEFVKLYT